MGLKMGHKSSRIAIFILDFFLFSFFFVLILSSQVSFFETTPVETKNSVKQAKQEKQEKQKMQEVQEVQEKPKSVQKKIKKAVKKYSLKIITTPKDAKVQILNIKPRFYQGMHLKAGKYKISISKKGYEKLVFWITLNHNTTLQESLLVLKDKYNG